MNIIRKKNSFAAVAPLLDQDQLFSFKRNEVKGFISINATLVLIAILLYVAAFAISLGPVMWTLLSEIFPGHIKGIAISVVGFFNSLVSYTVTQFFPWEFNQFRTYLDFCHLCDHGSLVFIVRDEICGRNKGKEFGRSRRVINQ